MLVLAGAGSGKTRVITCRVARLLREGVSPDRILAVTFTNKASREMAERVRRLTGPDLAAQLFVSTFHSFGLWLVRRFAKQMGVDVGCQVMDEADRSAMIRQIRQELNITEREISADELSAFLMRVKGLGEDAVEVGRSFGYVKSAHFEDFYNQYRERLKLARCLDFDDLILMPVKILSANSELKAKVSSMFDYVMVDEYQDTNLLQFQLLESLVDQRRNLAVVGDDDQSIYGWRGARIENILEFDKHFQGARVIKLTQNYRSEQNILGIANALISHNTKRHSKELWTKNRMSVPVKRTVCENDKEEATAITRKVKSWFAEGLPPDEIAVLYRTKGQARALQEAFRLASIGYRVVGSFDFFDRKEIRDLMAYLRLAANPADEASFRRVINYPVRGVGLATMQRIDQQRRKGLSVIDAARRMMDEEGSSLPPKTARALGEFLGLMKEANERLAVLSGDAMVHYCESLLLRSGMKEDLLAREGHAWQSVQGLMGMMRKAVHDGLCHNLEGFLERLALQQNEADFGSGESKDKLVTLMTVHASKGLEFQAVIVAGMVDQLFPHAKSAPDEAGIEEERRLFYVAITRAKRYLILSSFRNREERGEMHRYKLSRFIHEIPSELMEETQAEGVVSREDALAIFESFESLTKK